MISSKQKRKEITRALELAEKEGRKEDAQALLEEFQQINCLFIGFIFAHFFY